MVGAAHGHRIQSGSGLIRNDGFALEDHGQGAGPEFPGQHIGNGRHIPAIAGQPLLTGNMKNQWVVIGPSLSLEYPLDRFAVQAVSSQAVHCLRGDGHQAALPENLRGGADFILDLLLLPLGIPQIKI